MAEDLSAPAPELVAAARQACDTLQALVDMLLVTSYSLRSITTRDEAVALCQAGRDTLATLRQALPPDPDAAPSSS